MSIQHRPSRPSGKYLRALAALYGHDADRMQHFATLSRDEQAVVVRNMRTEGHSDHTIAAATKLSIEMVRRILAGSDDGR